MKTKFISVDDMAKLLAIGKKRLQNLGSQARVFRPTAHCRYHAAHVAILERVWMGVITPELGNHELTMLLERARKGDLPPESETRS